MIVLPVWCKCGAICPPVYRDQCEDCYCDEQVRLSKTRPKRIQPAKFTPQQEAESDRRAAFIASVFASPADAHPPYRTNRPMRPF